MVPYANKIINTVRGMLLKLPFAKSPTNISSLTVPKNLTGTEVSGNLNLAELAYRVSAINEYGETVASPEFTLTVGKMLKPVNVIGNTYTPGILPKGVYYYGVTAVSDSGETNIVNSFKVLNIGTPPPDWADVPASVTQDGQLPAGNLFYAVTCVIAGQETDLSTFLEVNVANNNAAITLKFLPVEGVDSYRVYGRSRTIPKRIAEIPAPVYGDGTQPVVFKDIGDIIPKEDAPTFNSSKAGINIIWEPVEGNVRSYKIYGRSEVDPAELKFIWEVQGNQTNFKDDGTRIPSYTPPIKNESGYADGIGVALKWNPVPNATGYRIYGRNKSYIHSGSTVEEKGLIATIDGQANTTFVDVGTLAPDMSIPFPVTDSTDGIRGVPGVVIPDGQTLVIDPLTGILSVNGGIDSFLGRSVISNLKDQDVLIYDAKLGKFRNMELSTLIYALINITTGTVVPIDPQFTDYKTNLASTLAALKTFKDEVQDIKAQIAKNKSDIAQVKDIIGTPFAEELN